MNRKRIKQACIIATIGLLIKNSLPYWGISYESQKLNYYDYCVITTGLTPKYFITVILSIKLMFLAIGLCYLFMYLLKKLNRNLFLFKILTKTSFLALHIAGMLSVALFVFGLISLVKNYEQVYFILIHSSIFDASIYLIVYYVIFSILKAFRSTFK